MDAFYIILAGILVATASGILGCFLILRKMAMITDAISHAVLPGIVIAFFISSGRDNIWMLLGAAVVGLLTTVIIEFMTDKAKLQHDAAIGITFTTLFAIGVIMISAFAGQVDLDQECVLYGEIAYLPLDSWITGGGVNMGPAPLYILGSVLLIVVIMVSLFYPYFSLTSFDHRYALAIGVSTSLWNYLLMALVSITTVASFESVGAILVVAFFVVPPATAYLVTNKLKQMIALTIIIGIFVSVSGYYLAVWINGSIAGAMSSMAGLFFLIAFIYQKWMQSVAKRQIDLKKTTLSTQSL